MMGKIKGEKLWLNEVFRLMMKLIVYLTTINHSDKEWDLVINEAIKSYVCDHLTQKQVHEAVKHTGKDAFPANEVLRTFDSSWINGES